MTSFLGVNIFLFKKFCTECGGTLSSFDLIRVDEKGFFLLFLNLYMKYHVALSLHFVDFSGMLSF